MTYTAFLILIVIVALLLILIIMVQNPKGGGLSSTFGGGGSQLGGVQNTNKFLDKTTWTLAIALFALILLSNFAIPRNKTVQDSQLKETLDGIEVTKEEPVAVPATDNSAEKPVEGNSTDEKKTEEQE